MSKLSFSVKFSWRNLRFINAVIRGITIYEDAPHAHGCTMKCMVMSERAAHSCIALLTHRIFSA